MFANFLYFIVVLLIHSLYQPTEETNFTGLEALFLFLLFAAMFASFTWLQFKRLSTHKQVIPLGHLEHRFQSLLTQQSIMAVLLFAINVYGLNLPAFFFDLPLFIHFPTLQALLFLVLFVGYLVIVWYFAHTHYQRYLHPDITWQAYVLSNISFAVPVLLPWIVFSGGVDIIHLLPFERAQQFLATPEGEILYYVTFLFIVAIVGPALIQKAWGCQPLKPGAARMRIEAICRRAGLGYADIVDWPVFGGRMITAGVMGLVKKFRYILVTKALLQLLAPEEIDTVIAHEIGHIKKKHLLFYLFFFAGYILFSASVYHIIDFLVLYALIVVFPSPSALFSFLDANSVLNSLRYLLILIISLLLYFRFIFGYFMRNFERQADTYVFTMFDSAWPLISTFTKIARTSGQPPDKPNWHHFSISERIDFLKKCETDRTWIRHHDRKIKKSLVVYVLGMLCILAASYQLNFGEPSRRLNARILEQLSIGDMIDHTDNPDIFIGLGDFYYNNQNYTKAIKAYEHALVLAPDSAHALNNLAWLFATSDDAAHRDYAKALELALQAAKIDRKPHILDTLAECYYVNGYIEKAIDTAAEALAAATENRQYFEEQLQKFESALIGE